MSASGRDAAWGTPSAACGNDLGLGQWDRLHQNIFPNFQAGQEEAGCQAQQEVGTERLEKGLPLEEDLVHAIEQGKNGCAFE